jgi:elongation factor G
MFQQGRIFGSLRSHCGLGGKNVTFNQALQRLTRSYATKPIKKLSLMRNIGISAHIDSGKTTLTERILYYTGRIDDIHEVRGKDGVGATMDNMDLEREKGITIKSAATHVTWGKHFINIIDTPGHVDFTIEVERSLHVLDGAILVVCGSSGVQSQTMTVDRQMKRYQVPRLVFINKLDRLGADPWKVIKGLKAKLGLNCAAIQIPIGIQNNHEGVIDIIERQAIYFTGGKGDTIEKREVNERMKPVMEEKRVILLEALANFDETIADKLLEGEEPTVAEIKAAIRKGVINHGFAPVLMGSAVKNKGVQPLIDAVCDYLPDPLERDRFAFDKKEEGTKVQLIPDKTLPLVAYAFKLEESKYGQLTWMRVYQGEMKKGAMVTNINLDKKEKVPRLVRMHAGELEDIDSIGPGDICAIYGVDCASGETFTDGSVQLQLNPMHVPAPVISLSISVKSQQHSQTFMKALKRFSREDPTFHVLKDPETQETLIAGMGELHLEIYVERMRREYDLAVVLGKPRVNFRETITSPKTFDYTHKKQSGGAGQYARIAGRIEPVGEDEELQTEFVNSILGNTIPPNYIPGIEKGFNDMLSKGPLIGHPVDRVRMILLDGAYHAVDSSEFAFRNCTHIAFTEAFMKAEPTLLEPVMSIEIQCPLEFQSAAISTLTKRRGTVSNAYIDGQLVTIEAEVPLALMFGYATELRSATEGKGEFAMEYQSHKLVPRDRLPGIIAEYKKKQQAEEKRLNS